MNRIFLGAILALALAGLGLFWISGRAEVESAAPPPDSGVEPPDPMDLPSADISDMMGPALPEATEMTKEQKRFSRYDRNGDGRITRVEMLASRTAAFRRLDVDGNNLLTFEEWAVTTVDKFECADVDGNDWLTPEEFARTASRRSKDAPEPPCR